MPLDIAEATRAAHQLKKEGRLEAAIVAYREIVAAFPHSAVSLHNLAAVLHDTGRASEADRMLARAMQMGLDAPETWLVRARAVQALGQFDAAEGYYRQALRRRPDYLDALRELSQLIWMRTGAAAEASKPFDGALLASPGAPTVMLTKARALAEMDQGAAALRVLRAVAAQHPGDPVYLVPLAQGALAEGEVQVALEAAEQSLAASNDPHVRIALIDALLVAGQPQRAALIAEGLRTEMPFEQHVLARLATAWRMMDDPRYRALYDYDAFVAVETLDTPPGWSTLDAFLADLADFLRGEHRFRTHPFNQSIKEGSQVPNVLGLDHPTARGLAFAIDAPIRRYIAKIGHGDDPMRVRNQGGYAVQGAWSIRMQAGGRHINHTHPEGWISSACYIETPPALEGHEGYLKFGEPGLPLNPLPAPEMFVEPKPGRLVLFPSYMWHGTVPFANAGVRMSFAFDLAPAPTRPLE